MSRETLHTWADTREPAETDFDKGYESARDYVQLQLIREKDVIAGLQAKLDALGVAIADAGYTWTPEMRKAYEMAPNAELSRRQTAQRDDGRT